MRDKGQQIDDVKVIIRCWIGIWEWESEWKWKWDMVLEGGEDQ